ncbi:MAG: UDP-N-acetylmuramate--L-alanine ligase [Deltaproteobacteria bacterium]|nr:MAG: UDP-N-acetylmuramate--L-alanine ligase [Deltaproteobacteria bacterium]
MKKIHFIGIGGVGMSALAELSLNLGMSIQGTEVDLNEYTYRLREMGVEIFDRYSRFNIKDVDLVIVSSGVMPNNVELEEASNKGIPIIPRARLLAEITRRQSGIIVTGSHGKTTTSGLIATLLEEAGKDPTFIIGGNIIDFESNFKHGFGNFVVIEADESDGSVFFFSPYIALLTNFDMEHVDYWKGGTKECCNVFSFFFNMIPFCGSSIICVDSFILNSFIRTLKGRVLTYGLNTNADYYIKNIYFKGGFTYFNVIKYGKFLGEFRTRLLGVHNIQNALGALIVADELQISTFIVAKTLESYAGINRRLTYIGERKNILVIDDYAHHPTEIAVVIKTIKRLFYNRRLVVLFEPHRATRFYHLLNEFIDAFSNIDMLFLCDVYFAGEINLFKDNLIKLVKETSNLNFLQVGSISTLASKLISIVKDGDIVLTLGAGHVSKWAWHIYSSL